MNILSLFLLLTIFLLIYYSFKKINLLNENINYSVHKNFGETNKSPVIIGGTFLIIIVLFFFTNNLFILKISLLLMYFLGLLSDKNILPSPKIRIILQILILSFLVFFSELKIDNLENNLLNNILKNNLANLFFTIFCCAILINGSNFLDGLNGLLSGYYLMIILSIFFVCFNNDEILFIYENELKIFFLSLLVFFIFNIFGKVYLGDGGSYLIAAFIGFYLIEFILSNHYLYISPYYVASILWYPTFENLFSLSRRLLKKNKISSPDNKHLHQLIFLFVKSKNFIKNKYLNTTTSMIILTMNLPAFIFSSLMFTYSQGLVLIILANIILYILVYGFISKNLKIKE
jgi:UDP-N-acetylmuramyl pentapeptide phosphotransferase/UDP-N-acetylglucosamine-1-phosphate transferase